MLHLLSFDEPCTQLHHVLLPAQMMWLELVSWVESCQGPPRLFCECTSASWCCSPSPHTGTAQLVTISSTSSSDAWFTAAIKQPFPSVSGRQKRGIITILSHQKLFTSAWCSVFFFPHLSICQGKMLSTAGRPDGVKLQHCFPGTTSKEFISSLDKFSHEWWNYGSGILQTVSQSSLTGGVNQEGASSDWRVILFSQICLYFVNRFKSWWLKKRQVKERGKILERHLKGKKS